MGYHYLLGVFFFPRGPISDIDKTVCYLLFSVSTAGEFESLWVELTQETDVQRPCLPVKAKSQSLLTMHVTSASWRLSQWVKLHSSIGE